MKQFVAQGDTPIVSAKMRKSLKINFVKQMKRLHFPTLESKKLIADIAALITRIQATRTNGADAIVDNYIQSTEDTLKLIGHNVKRLTAKKARLHNYYTLINESKKLRAEILQLIEEINKNHVVGYNQFLSEYIHDVEERVNGFGYDHRN